LNIADESPEAVMCEGWFDPRRLAPLGDGHINETLLVETDRGRFVLQRINERVFPDPQAVAEKVHRVVAYLQSAAPGRVPALEPTRRGDYVWRDDRGGFWRLWHYVENTRTLQELNNSRQAQSAGRAFGELQNLLRGFPSTVDDPVPGFMQLDHYLGAFETALNMASAPSADAENLLGFIEPRRGLAELFAVRDRLVHADCKVDNLLFSVQSDEVVGILDLDTVMFGHWAWDFGDLARSAAVEAGGFSVDRLVALVKGFVPAAGIDPTPDELLMAPRYVALMLGVRFLTDHLRGDRYFRVTAPGDNLRRAREQFALLQDMEREESQLREFLRRV
jgi:Ser/Thr protein kinase RdoA (MazF antagonist)